MLPGPAAIRVGERLVGPGHPVFVIAEAGVNHNGDVRLARRLVDAAAEAGADGVKFQTFKAERLVTPTAQKAAYQARATGGGESQLEMLRRLELSPDAHSELSAHCRERGVLFLSTPFDARSADLLAQIGVPMFKVPSGEITNLPFLKYLAGLGKPLVISTGMASLGEVESAVRAVEGAGNREFVLLHCVSNYPADPHDVNLRAMQTMEAAFGHPVGYSDHTLGTEVALAAVALGACVIEKHFTLDRSMKGPDHRASLEPHELAALVKGIRSVEAALGSGRKQPAPSEADTASVARKNLVAARDLRAGTTLTEELIDARRAGKGLPVALLSQVVGWGLRVDVPAGTPLSLDMLIPRGSSPAGSEGSAG